MASTISTNEVVRIAQLARLHLTEDEIKSFSKDLSEILDYMYQINKVDVSNVRLTDNMLVSNTVLRPDVAHQSLSLDQLLNNAAEVNNGYFSVQHILGED